MASEAGTTGSALVMRSDAEEVLTLSRSCPRTLIDRVPADIIRSWMRYARVRIRIALQILLGLTGLLWGAASIRAIWEGEASGGVLSTAVDALLQVDLWIVPLSGCAVALAVLLTRTLGRALTVAGAGTLLAGVLTPSRALLDTAPATGISSAAQRILSIAGDAPIPFIVAYVLLSPILLSSAGSAARRSPPPLSSRLPLDSPAPLRGWRIGLLRRASASLLILVFYLAAVWTAVVLPALFVEASTTARAAVTEAADHQARLFVPALAFSLVNCLFLQRPHPHLTFGGALALIAYAVIPAVHESVSLHLPLVLHGLFLTSGQLWGPWAAVAALAVSTPGLVLILYVISPLLRWR